MWNFSQPFRQWRHNFATLLLWNGISPLPLENTALLVAWLGWGWIYATFSSFESLYSARLNIRDKYLKKTNQFVKCLLWLAVLALRGRWTVKKALVLHWILCPLDEESVSLASRIQDSDRLPPPENKNKY